jgi:hypothetical protein
MASLFVKKPNGSTCLLWTLMSVEGDWDSKMPHHLPHPSSSFSKDNFFLASTRTFEFLEKVKAFRCNENAHWHFIQVNSERDKKK